MEIPENFYVDFDGLDLAVVNHIKYYFIKLDYSDAETFKNQLEHDLLIATPKKDRIKALEKGILCLQKIFPQEGKSRRQIITENLIEKLNFKINNKQEPGIKNSDYTTARQVLAVHYLFEVSNVKGIDSSIKARFIEFLTGKSYKNIYDAVLSPLNTKDGNFRKDDLQYIRPYFEKLELFDIVDMINNELSTSKG